MQKGIKNGLIWLIAAIVIVAGVFMLMRAKNSPSNQNQQTTDLYTFAQCLKDKGAVFYGAFWCPHCQSQKEAFGDAQKNLPYVECSTPDSKGQTKICEDNKIEGYPTWVFADGSRLEGELSFQTLAKKTGCISPQ